MQRYIKKCFFDIFAPVTSSLMEIFFRKIWMALFLSVLSAVAYAGGPGMSVLGREDRGPYDCLLVEYDVPGSGKLRSLLLLPDGASAQEPCPGLVLLHDHGARFDIGKEKLARPMASAPLNIRRSALQWVRDNFDGVFLADSLAALGYAVIVPDMLYWGGRSTVLARRWSRMRFCGEAGDIDSVKTALYEGQKAVYDSLEACGVTWAWKTLQEDAAAAGLLRGLPCVDKDRIAVAGWSMGAHRAWMLAGFSDFIASGVSVCWMTLKETLPQPYKASDYAMLVPELRAEYDFPDIARRLVPRPYCFLNGKSDRLFPEEAVREAFAKMQDIYMEAGAGGRLETAFFDGGHHCGKQVQGQVVDFLEKTVPLRRRICSHGEEDGMGPAEEEACGTHP